MIKFIFRVIFALLMVGIVFGLVGMYLWEVTGREDYVAPAEVEDAGSDNIQDETLEADDGINFAPEWSFEENKFSLEIPRWSVGEHLGHFDSL